MNRSGAGALMLGTLLLAVGCESQPNTVTAPSTSGPATQPQPPQPPPPATNFEVTGVVTSEQGVPVAGAVVTMANGPYSSWPSTVSDGSGGYRIAFSATSTGSGFVARAQVIAEGYELYWRSLFTNSFANNNVESFRLYPVKRVTAGDSSVVAFPSDVGECTGWVARRCGIMRVTIPSTGILTVEVTPTDSSGRQPTLEICCVSGNEIYGNPLTLPLDGLVGSELLVLVTLRDDSTAAESFVVKTSFQKN